MINACVASPEADSFLTEAEASKLMQLRDRGWLDRTQTERENVMRIAAHDISRIRFKGRPLYATQGLAFPRYADIVAGQRTVSALSPVITVSQNVPADSVIDDNAGMLTANFGVALVPGTTTRPCTFSAVVDGIPIVYVDNTGDGTAGIATVDYANGIIDFPGVAVDPTTMSATWVQANQTLTSKVSSDALILDTLTNLPDAYVGGSVHVIISGGGRRYLNVIAHDIENGVLTLDDEFPIDFTDAVFHPPVFPVVKEAQIAQMCKILRLDTGIDPYIGTGIVSIKIDDTERRYATDQYGIQSIKTIAMRNGVAEHVMVLLGYLTLYGTINLITQEDEDTAYERE